MYSLAYGRMGDDAVAAITIATTIQDIAVVLFQGLSAATAVILGHELGAGHLKQAEKYATQFFILQFLVTVTADILLVLGRWKSSESTISRHSCSGCKPVPAGLRPLHACENV